MSPEAVFYQVGGSVRDSFNGVKSKDVDYAVEAESFEALKEAITSRGGDIFLEQPKYFTIRAKIQGLGTCDFVLCRKEGSYYDGRHPDGVEVGTIYDDLARRDFTINAIAIRESDGKVIDPFDGRSHIALKTLKCVGSPQERFTEDGLRMLRAIRFEITGHYYPELEITRCLSDPIFFKERLKGVSVGRIRDELYKCFHFSTKDTLAVLNTYRELRSYLFESGTLWLKPTLEHR